MATWMLVWLSGGLLDYLTCDSMMVVLRTGSRVAYMILKTSKQRIGSMVVGLFGWRVG